MGQHRERIEPRTLKGFRDYLPAAAIPRERLMEVARSVYRSFGFVPIDTPALEYEEILAGKGGEESEKQMFRFEDHGGRRVALRFDLTVPLARFVAQHADELGMPFKRYHIGTVWRGEKPQRGRYREFVQCDFDTIGTASPVADVETALVIVDLMRALGLERFQVRVNDRRLLGGLIERKGLGERQTEVLRAIDKLDKIGPEEVERELVESAGASPAAAAELARLARPGEGESALLARLEREVAGSERGAEGLAALRALAGAVRAAGVAPERVAIDPRIARGLDYYTGTVYETVLEDLPGIGSVCSGGRYDDLASLYGAQRLPGVGASLGVDRLLAALEELGLVEQRATTAELFLPFFVEERLHDYLALAARLRREGISVEFYPEPKKLGAQLKHADRRGFPAALVIGPDEWASGTAQLKDLGSGASESVALAEVSAAVRRLLASRAHA